MTDRGPSEADDALAAERERLVRLCRRLTGDPSVAEELAQEALLKGWRRAEQLREPARRGAWLATIARNECFQWLRRRGRAPMEASSLGSSADAIDLVPDLADDVDLAGEVERRDVARLLQRALRALPESTRRLLVERYVEDVPLAELAAHRGTSPGTIAVRLHRARQELRRVLLLTTLPGEIAELGLDAPAEPSGWRTTDIWCPWCGRFRLQGILDQRLAVFRLRCPTCGSLNDSHSPALFAAARGYRPALERLLAWADRLYKHSLVASTVACPGCGVTLRIFRGTANDRRLITYYCSRCRAGTWNGQTMNVLSLPESRRFWREHPRMRSLPERAIEVDGRPAIVAGFASLGGAARLEVVYARDTLDLLAVHGARRRGGTGR